MNASRASSGTVPTVDASVRVTRRGRIWSPSVFTRLCAAPKLTRVRFLEHPGAGGAGCVRGAGRGARGEARSAAQRHDGGAVEALGGLGAPVLLVVGLAVRQLLRVRRRRLLQLHRQLLLLVLLLLLLVLLLLLLVLLHVVAERERRTHHRVGAHGIVHCGCDIDSVNAIRTN